MLDSCGTYKNIWLKTKIMWKSEWDGSLLYKRWLILLEIIHAQILIYVLHSFKLNITYLFVDIRLNFQNKSYLDSDSRLN